MVRFTANKLSLRESATVYALVRTALPEVEPEQWLDFSSWLEEQGGGVLAVIAGDSAPVGMAAFRPDRSLRHGHMLKVELLVAFELHRSAPVRAALIEALEQIARELGCESLGLALPRGASSDAGERAAAPWEALGHARDCLLLVRPLARTAGVPAETRGRDAALQRA